MKTITEVRKSFWQSHPEFMFDYKGEKVRQNRYGVDIRCAFVDYVAHLQRDGTISTKLANRVTL